MNLQNIESIDIKNGDKLETVYFDKTTKEIVQLNRTEKILITNRNLHRIKSELEYTQLMIKGLERISKDLN